MAVLKKHKTKVTSVRLPPKLIEAVRESGVGNLSKLVTGLLENWLAQTIELDESVMDERSTQEDSLKEIEQEWHAYVKKEEMTKKKQEVSTG